MESIIEIDNFLTDEEMRFIDSEILSDIVPWHYIQSSTSDKFPFFGHIIIPRCEFPDDPIQVTSPLHQFFTDIQVRFCNYTKIPLNKIYRQCLNLTFPSDGYEFGDPHTDHDFDHKNMIMYLNDDYDMGETILFDQGKIAHEVKPKKGKIICFDGNLSHTVRWIPRGRRIIFVSTFG